MANPDFFRASWSTTYTTSSTSSGLDGAQPAFGNSASASTYASCCAFHMLDANTNSTQNQSQSQTSPQFRFIKWVMLCRVADEMIPLRERFSCPMAKCDALFDGSDPMQLVRHISGCQHLSDGMYKCPYHDSPRIERFMEAARPSQARRFFRRRFFRQTIEKICELGSRGRRSRTEQTRPLVYSSVEEKQSHPISAKRPYQDDGPIPAPVVPDQGPVELDAMPEGCFVQDESMVLPVHSNSAQFPVYDDAAMYAIPQSATIHNAGNDFGEIELPNSFADTLPEMDAPHIPELSEKRMSTSTIPSPSLGCHTPDSALSPISPVSPVSPMTPRSFYSTEGFDLPVSPTDLDLYGGESARSVMETKSMISDNIYKASLMPQPAVSPTTDVPSPGSRRQIPHIRVDTSNTTPPVMEHISPLSSMPSESPVSETSELAPPASSYATDDESHSSKQLVQELRGLFNCLFKLSMKKLCRPALSDAGAHLLSMRPSAAILFSAGVEGLKKVVNNEMPKEFMEVFGLSILPYACGVAGANENLQDQFAAIFQEQLGWSQAIADEQLRKTYVDLVWELWSTSEYQMSAAHPSSQQFMTSGADALAQLLELGNSYELPEFSLDTPESSMMAASTSAYHLGFQVSPFSLHDTAIKLCLNFLDSFEYLEVNIQEVTVDAYDTPGLASVPPHPEYSSILMQQVTQPLETNLSLAAFKPVANLTSFLISKTQNITLRNTELSLLEEGKDRDNAPMLLHDFSEEVRTLCDNAATVMGCPGYRSFYYLSDINKVIDIHTEFLAIERWNRERWSRSVSLGSAPSRSPVTASPTSSNYSGFSSAPYRSYAFNFSSSTSSSPIEAGMYYHSRSNSSENVFASTSDRSFSFSQSSPTVRAHSDGTTAEWSCPPASKRVNASHSRSGEGSATRGGSRPDEKVTRHCPHCGQPFKQQAQYIKANITRHIREKHGENGKKLTCSVPGCTYTTPRKGNLTQHRRSTHHLPN